MADLVTCKNEKLTFTASTVGAELQSIQSNNGISYLWHGDAAYWGGRAPNLFPFVGALRNGRAHSAQGDIVLPRHGFGRKAEFAVEKTAADSVTYRLDSTEETRKVYPYEFSFRVTHALKDDALTTVYRVTNTGDQPLPFCVGGHPAFNVPLVPGENYEDYRIEFPEKETIDSPQIDLEAGLIMDHKRNRLMTDGTAFHLNHILFRGDAIVMDRLRSRSVRLVSDKSGHGVKMDFDGMEYFAVWSPFADSPFVCLEPWTGTATQYSEDDVFEHKQGVKILAPGEESQVSYTVTMF